MSFYHSWKPYVPVAKRREQAARKLAKLQKKGATTVSPVVIEGRTIASSFWGKAWCGNLERYSDYASRLPRGRSYVRNGSVLDLQIAEGEITARVSHDADVRAHGRCHREIGTVRMVVDLPTKVELGIVVGGHGGTIVRLKC